MLNKISRRAKIRNKSTSGFIFALFSLVFAGHPISIDGIFNDWDQVPITYSDVENDAYNADFSTLNGVLELFINSTPESAAAGWIHYLAFDFWMGAWILKNSQNKSIPHVIIIFPLIFTFILGPFGILLNYIITNLYFKLKK